MLSREPNQRRAPEIEQDRMVRIARLDQIAVNTGAATIGNEPAQSIVGANPNSAGLNRS